MTNNYKKLSLREQILLRPDTYIGAVTPEEIETYTWDTKSNKFSLKLVNFSRGLMRLFEEIYENAMDQAIRSNNTDKIEIVFANGYISVKNNTGKDNIPIELNKENVYIPQMIFCELLTSSNYDDSVKRLTAGRNGYGAKLTNIFSKHFIIDVVTNGKSYHQECSNNMSIINSPVIKSTKEKNYTKITFLPDYNYFKINPNDMLELFYKKCCDISACLNSFKTTVKDSISVYLNNNVIPIKKFDQYISFYTDETPAIYIDPANKISIAITHGESFNAIGFVNGVSCNSGAHIKFITDKIINNIKTGKLSDVKPSIIKNCINVYTILNVENPTFTTQTKEELVTPQKLNLTFPDSFIKKVNKLIKESIKDSLEQQAKLEERKALKAMNKTVKRTSKIYDIPKLMDAEKAGSNESLKCKLFICEGDSAAGLGRIILSQSFKYNGLFPIRGRLLNVRNATNKQISENAEIQSLLRILGLKIGEKAKIENLRYGGLVCLVDSDVFGIGAIQSLIMNFIHYFWPELLQENFFFYFRTPIIKINLKNNTIKYFYSLPEYNKFTTSNHPPVTHTKYIKGLGTIETSFGKEMSNNIENYLIPFQPKTNDDDESIDRTFNKNRADDRKEWINATKNIIYDAEEEQNQRINHGLNITDYFNKDVAEFSRYNLEISIPNIMDGFKPSQRKIIYTALKRNINSQDGIKVAQLGPMVAQMTAYKHGENNLMETIINLAQDFTGSNNINFLRPIGQFGSRYNNTAASPRYIYTSLNPITRKIFREEDDHIIKYIFDEGEYIEPEYYIPVIPTILVNGALGLGTGWSTKIPMWNVKDIINYIKNALQNKPLNKINYHYNGFIGELIETKTGFISRGVYKITGNKIHITEIPLDISGEDYKMFLNDLVIKGQLLDVVETDTEKISFIITVPSDSPILKDPIKQLKLEKSFPITNMHLFDKDGLIKKYNNVYEIINEWINNRYPWYAVRKNYIIKSITEELNIAENKHKFLSMIMNDQLTVYKVPKQQIINKLTELKFIQVDNSYNYLLNLSVTSFTKEMITKLEETIQTLTTKLNNVKQTSEKQMWINDLEEIEQLL